ncbi:MAG: hypothetical protein IPO37_25705 [Saprospiraceae bacterium]|nr:hypothetical protein [Saprospiraceae bacterium]
MWAVQTILDTKHIVEQTYNACLGILRLADKYGNERLENASKRAAAGHRATYGILQAILQNNMDKIEIPINEQENEDRKLPAHDNLRGPVYYSQTTLHFIN